MNQTVAYAIDATPARWRALLDSVIKAASSPRNDFVNTGRLGLRDGGPEARALLRGDGGLLPTSVGRLQRPKSQQYDLGLRAERVLLPQPDRGHRRADGALAASRFFFEDEAVFDGNGHAPRRRPSSTSLIAKICRTRPGPSDDE